MHFCINNKNKTLLNNMVPNPSDHDERVIPFHKTKVLSTVEIHMVYTNIQYQTKVKHNDFYMIKKTLNFLKIEELTSYKYRYFDLIYSLIRQQIIVLVNSFCRFLKETFLFCSGIKFRHKNSMRLKRIQHFVNCTMRCATILNQPR